VSPSGRIEGIDLLRGLAIALVMARHAVPDVLPGAGVVGVVMFFTLSGYLITGLLRAELASRGRIDLRRFWARRALRLLPALLVMVAGLVVVTLVLDPLGERPGLPRAVLVALTYTADLPFAHGSDAVFHLWTLAVEEQFYLVWPLVVVLLAGRLRWRTTLVVAAAACLLACVAVVVLVAPDVDRAYPLPTTWAVCFVIGAAARAVPDGRRVPRVVVAASMLALVALSVLPLRGHALTYLAGGSVMAVLTAALLVAWGSWHVVGARLAPARVALRGLVALGTVSYGAYLWNYPVTLWLRPTLGAAAGAVAVAVTLVLAALSWRLVEAPVLRLRDRRPRRLRA
jgi:peptidoglycan/LPS O-acetylase OafA/YrhL